MIIFMGAIKLIKMIEINYKKISILILFSLIFVNSVFAQANIVDLEVNYDGNVKGREYNIGGILSIPFIVYNNEYSSKNIKIIREISSGENLISHEGGVIKYMVMEHLSIPYIEYNIEINAKSSISFYVESKYALLPSAGKIALPEITVIDKDTNEIISHSDPFDFIILKCKVDNFCDNNIRENSMNCPQDCETGREDGICDMKKDGRCDPNCLTELDSDCKVGEGITKIPSLPKLNIDEPQKSGEKSLIGKAYSGVPKSDLLNYGILLVILIVVVFIYFYAKKKNLNK